MKKILFYALLLISSSVFGYNSLRIGDPRNSWTTNQGSIDEAILSVSPKGLFMEYGLFLTFSAKGTNYNQNDTLEVNLNFDLPKNSIVTDSWLWIGKDISKAIILDKWSASLIYESIVNRRKDPSILTKLSETSYQLKIFPMVGNSTRKVKITYLVPVEIDNYKLNSTLPTNILLTSKMPVNGLYLLLKENVNGINPSIINYSTAVIEHKTNEELGTYKQVRIPYSLYNSNLKLAYTSNQPKGLLFTKNNKGSEGTYQLAFSPSNFLEKEMGNKIAFLLDFDIANTGLLNTDIINNLKSEMLSKLTPKDSFVVLFSNINIKKSSNKWQEANTVNIEQAFETLKNTLSSYSNLISLMNSGIEFIKSNGKSGAIILISNSGQYGTYTVANTLINDLINISSKNIPFHIADYQSLNLNYNYINGTYYYGNEYLYVNLSKMTGGTYQRVKDGNTQSEIISMSIKNINGILTSFDLHTKLATGFCFSRYNIDIDQSAVFYNDIIRQVGKYNGTFPFVIEFSGLYGNKPFTKTIQIEEQESIQGDSNINKIWTGQYIKELEKSNQTNTVVNNIIYNSIKDRVLSLYTSFLCLENKIYYCDNCIDETKLVKVITPAENSLSLKLYPNPFDVELSIEFDCESPEKVSEISIYNLNGSEICRFETKNLIKGKNILKWNGITSNGKNIQAGIYLLKFKSDKENITLRVVKK